MPITSLGTTSLRRSEAAPQAAAPAPAGDAVGHGVTRLKARPSAYAVNPPLIPGTPPPKRETAGAHGAHKGRISIR
jgi:hypothetical protein